MRYGLGCTALALASLSSAGIAHAQAADTAGDHDALQLAQSEGALQATSAAPAAASDSGALDEIIVTAQKRNESIMDVPISVSVAGGEMLTQQASVSLADISVRLPAMKVSEGTRTNRLFIRGIGSADNIGFEQSVGTFVDGIYLSRSKLSASLMFDLDRIEVLKGPQSIFFGNSTIAGAVNITTNSPSRELEGSISALYEPTHNERNLDAAISIPITDSLSGRVAIRYYAMDGWLNNVDTGDQAPKQRTYAGRGTLVWRPADVFDVTLKAEAAKIDFASGVPWQLTLCPPDPVYFPSGPRSTCLLALQRLPNFEDKFNRDYSASPNQQGYLESYRTSLTANYEIGAGVTLTSVTGLVTFESLAGLDSDQTVLTLLHSDGYEKFRQVSQEIRVTSPSGGALEYIAGLYYQGGRIENISNQRNSLATPYSLIVRTFNQDERTLSGFGALTFNPTDSLHLTAGARYSNVRKTAFRLREDGTTTDPDFFSDRSDFTLVRTPIVQPYARRFDRKFTPSANIRYDLNSSVMAYFTYASGFKSGGFDAAPPTNTVSEFDAELADSFEAGLKATLFNRRVRLSLAAFHTTYEGLQQSVYQQSNPNVLGIFITDNVGRAISKGLDADISWQVTPDFQLQGAATLLSAKTTEYQNGPCAPSVPACPQDLSGRTLPYAPKYSGAVTATYERDISNSLGVNLSATLAFTDGFYTASTLDVFTYQDRYAKVDARAELNSPDGWYVAVVGKNLNNAYTSSWTFTSGVAIGSYFAMLERTRSVALQAGYKF